MRVPEFLFSHPKAAKATSPYYSTTLPSYLLISFHMPYNDAKHPKRCNFSQTAYPPKRGLKSLIKLKIKKRKENRRGRRRVKRVREERVCFVDKNKIGSNRTGGGTWVLVFFSKQKKLREDGFNFQYYLLWASHTSVFGRFVVIGRFPTCKSHLKVVRFQYSTRFTSSTEMVFVLVFGIGHVGDAVNNVLSPKCSQDLDLSIHFCRLNW